MELKEFISTTISEICDGIAVAKAQVNNKFANCIVAPGHINGESVGNRPEDRYDIDFDVCVTVEESGHKNGSLSAKLKVINFDKNSGTNNNTVHINRVRFSVPYLPQGFIVKSKSVKK